MEPANEKELRCKLTDWYGRRASCAHTLPRDDPIALGYRWEANPENPYPSKEQLSAWIELGILTSKQISDFFVNKRKRNPANRSDQRPSKTPITVINFDGIDRRVR
jgi:hypothetical protein